MSGKTLDQDEMTIRARAKLERLIAEKGVKPMSREVLRSMGDLWPEDENIDDFINTLREWRSEKSERTVP